MIPVRQSTAFETAIGPVLDADGVAVTNCVVGDFKIKKTTGNFAALNGSATLTHVSAGFYDLVLTTSDTDTVGLACVAIDDTTNGCAPLYLQVVEEAVYDAMFAASAAGFLQPTVAGRTLDVTATGAAGIDWANVENPTTALNLSGTNIDVDQVVASVTGAVGSVTGAVASVTGNVGGNVTGSVGSVASGGITAASFAADALARLGIVAYGTAQAATSTTLQLASASTFADDELNGAVVVITGGTTGVGQSRVITDYVSSTDTATVDAWTTTPTGTITYVVFAAPPASATALPAVNVTQFGGSAGTFSGGRPEVNTTHAAGTAWGSGAITAASIATDAITAAKVAADAVTEIQSGLATAAALTTIDDFLDTEVAAILAAVDTEVGAIKTKTDYLPSATAGAAGGLFIAGANAATTVDITGSLSGSVGSVTGAVGSVTGNVGGNVTGSVGSVTGSVGSVATGGISAASLASDAGAEIADAVLDEVVEGSYTLRQLMRLVAAAVGSKVSGAATTTVTFRDTGDTKDRIVATVTADGDRTAVTLDLT